MTTTAATVTLSDVRAAAARIGDRVARTPVPELRTLSAHAGASVHGKLETLQPTGSFKVRGAFNHLLAHPGDGPVVAFSTGNHGRAVAAAARALGRGAIVFVGAWTDPAKIASLRDCDADVRVEGDTQAQAEAAARALATRSGLDLVAPFDDPEVIAGQGTIALELVEQLPDLDAVVVPVSGGGLIAGIALAAKALAPGVRVIGVGAAHTAQMYASLQAGRPVAAADDPTLADSLRGGIGEPNHHTFALARAHVDEVHVVSEDAIGEAMAYGLGHEGLVLEGAAAVGIAALLQGIVDVAGARVAVVLTGRGVDVARACAVHAAHRDALARRLGRSRRPGGAG